MARRFVKHGLPLIVMVVGGSFALSQHQQVKIDFKKNAPKQIDREELRRLGLDVKNKGEVTLESEYEKVKNLDIDNWENKRGPRPWEEDNELVKEALERTKRVAELKKESGDERAIIKEPRKSAAV